MRKIVLTYGIISGALIATVMLIGIASIDPKNVDFDQQNISGYVSMILGLSLIFVGIKQVRDKHLGGSISFGGAFKTGLLIFLLADGIYSLSWTVYNEASGGTFMKLYAEKTLETIEDPAEREATESQMEFFKGIYSNPIGVFFFTLLEMIPVGIPLILIAAFVFKRKKPIAIE